MENTPHTMNSELYHHGIKGMKWGIRRYQNKDGSLTVKGQKRYERDQRENAGKKKGNKVATADPNRWVKEDLERSKTLANESANLTRNLKSMNDKSMKNKPKKAMDLSSMTEKEMREQINRKLLERQYNDLFAPENVSQGRERVSQILDVTTDVLAVTGSALSIALAIKTLKG